MFSRTLKYAVIGLAQLALRGGGPSPVRELARGAGIPYPFLAKLVPPLVRAGILISARGRGGGVRFGRPPERISLADIVRALEGEEYLWDCPFALDPCPGKRECPLAPLWDPVREELVRFLERTTLADIARGKEEE
ncbi:MAG TPA: Rrf2 family transcriptional regulator [Candidatus Acetothermia bacterium]|nr:Rrf2 family transcriptional regulator [Candidatus Acetothermia bacterium]